HPFPPPLSGITEFRDIIRNKAQCRKGQRPLEMIEARNFQYKLLEPVLLLGFAGVRIRVHVKGAGHVAQIYAIWQSFISFTMKCGHVNIMLPAPWVGTNTRVFPSSLSGSCLFLGISLSNCYNNHSHIGSNVTHF
uniref:Uncharacterized protein n=1 Tax=Salvator merianae TaxID=96440 RepID=A0A8D0C9M1_SALMN